MTRSKTKAIAHRIAYGLILGSAYLALAGGIVTMRISDAHPHSWYTTTKDPETKLGCCGGQDCKEIPESSVKADGKGGYIYLPTGEHIPASRVQQSFDWQFHRCEYLYDIGGAYKKGDTRCFFAPGGTM